jgi:hypothetical protein
VPTTPLLVCRIWKWVGALPPPPIGVAIGMSWGDLYLNTHTRVSNFRTLVPVAFRLKCKSTFSRISVDITTEVGVFFEDLLPYIIVRSAVFWDITQRWVVVPHWRSGTNCQSHLEGTRSSRRLRLLYPWWDRLGCPETSVRNYHSTLRNIPKECRSYLHQGGSQKPLIASCSK